CAPTQPGPPCRPTIYHMPCRSSTRVLYFVGDSGPRRCRGGCRDPRGLSPTSQPTRPEPAGFPSPGGGDLPWTHMASLPYRGVGKPAPPPATFCGIPSPFTEPNPTEGTIVGRLERMLGLPSI